MKSVYLFALGSLCLTSLGALDRPTVLAQQSTAREVVQPLPSQEVQRLNRALLDLARRPQSVAAMLEAGDASLAVGDLDAAIGFYGSAAERAPSDPRIKLGLARVYLRSGRPVEALPLLEEAQTAGAEQSDILGPRALAYDLLGDQEAAQRAYVAAIALSPQDDELRRRLAISEAISGDAAGFQKTLAPLIEARDVAAFRARAFGLAILGEQERAEGIVNSVMPPDISARINPYLAYMPRLTPAQQAAAANLGIFPRAAEIGREDPRIARFVAENASGSRLEPKGEPLGLSSVDARERELARVPEVSSPDPQPEVIEGKAGPSLPSLATTEVATPDESVRPETVQDAVKETEVASVADAFAEFDITDTVENQPSSDAVNIAELDVPREVAAQTQPATELSEPEHPRRIWVQLATGRDIKALGFDWRRLSRRAPDLLGEFEPHVTPWGRANRLLAGPIENTREARRLVNALAEKGLETFAYTSPEGTEIKELK